VVPVLLWNFDAKAVDLLGTSSAASPGPSYGLVLKASPPTMPMSFRSGGDPFAALDLTGDLAHFVNYTSKLVASTHEIYKSSTGSSKNHDHLEGIASRLLELNCSLEQRKGFSFGFRYKSYNKALEGLRTECVKDAEALLNLMKALRAKKDSKWSSFRKALRSEWKKEEVDLLEGRIKDHRSELAIHLTAMLRYVIIWFLVASYLIEYLKISNMNCVAINRLSSFPL
jgi:hypothetical protein